ncbi:NAD-dependent epimerase/dehydratase family protein [Gammaproteobacteria bacterium]|nr:NAD-dependent epimerase/dehydratase family protein [Gammaproteobacteria bacterium]MDB9946882.1 NAD-dependent epimerase/dehydratase family protein [Gammaproteobacteria bacterium]
MKKILVTGGAGNIGSSLVAGLLKSENYHVSILDNLSTGSLENLPQSNKSFWRFIDCDVNNLTQLKQVLNQDTFNYIFHYAALVGVERTQKNPLKVLEDIEGIKNILNLAVECKAERIFYSSSSEVYGEPVEIPQNEITTPLNSKVPYAIVKSVGESFMRTFHDHHQLDFTIMRFFNTYGPRQKNDFVISKFIELALQNKDITIYGDGSQTRSFLHVDDNIEFTIKILKNKKLLNDVVNVGSDIEIKIIDLANMIIENLLSKSKIIFLPPLKEGDMTRRKPDISKMKEVYQKEIISLEEGIELVASANKSENT